MASGRAAATCPARPGYRPRRMTDLPTAFYEPAGDGVLDATELTRGPWDPGFQHAGPPSALLARAVDAAGAIDGGQLARITVDVLRPIPIAPLRVEARTLRPGRRIEQLDAELSLAGSGEVLMRARAWRIRAEAFEVPGDARVAEEPLPAPDGLAHGQRPAFFDTDVAYYDAFDWRFVHGRFEQPGPAACWTRQRVPLVAGEPASPVERMLAMADAASGISAALDWSRYTFANVDFSVIFERPPAGDWLGMDAVTRIGDAGAGVCTGLLSDERGRVGVSTQALFVSAR